MSKMINELQQLFNDTFSMSELMNDREKIETEDIISDYPDGITITEFEKVSMNDDEFYVYTFKEDKEKFAFGGFMINKFFDNVVEKYGDEEKANKALSVYGGIKIVFESKKTKKGQPITNIRLG